MYDPERSGRMKVLQEVERGHLTQKPAGAQLKLRERWGRKLPACLGKERRRILHRLRGLNAAEVADIFRMLIPARRLQPAPRRGAQERVLFGAGVLSHLS